MTNKSTPIEPDKLLGRYGIMLLYLIGCQSVGRYSGKISNIDGRPSSCVHSIFASLDRYSSFIGEGKGTESLDLLENLQGKLSVPSSTLPI